MKKIALATLFCGVVLVSGCMSITRSEPAGHYMDNNVVTAKVKARLIEELGSDSRHISVNTHNGQVQLSGYVDSKAEAKQAAFLAGSTPGVLKVRNNLIVNKKP
ncbi:MAG: BON domain-containing protein [Gammaproteobacteria bacterium]|nr:BON domain-containing protein [Gammaproteobacteria bacterium]